MDSTVDQLSEAYDALVAAVTNIIEARAAGGEQQRTAATDAAMEELHRRMDLFHADCDKAEELINASKTRFELEHMAELGSTSVDGATAEMKRDAVDP